MPGDNPRRIYRQVLSSLDDTRRLAQRVAHAFEPQTIVLLGTLGAGKTQWIRYFAEALGVPAEEVTSPTYVLLQRYRGSYPIYHFDFYRLQRSQQVWELGIDELYEQPVFVLIEWADRFPECLPDEYLQVQLEIEPGQDRHVAISAHGERTNAQLEAWIAGGSEAS